MLKPIQVDSLFLFFIFLFSVEQNFAFAKEQQFHMIFGLQEQSTSFIFS